MKKEVLKQRSAYRRKKRADAGTKRILTSTAAYRSYKAKCRERGNEPVSEEEFAKIRKAPCATCGVDGRNMPRNAYTSFLRSSTTPTCAQCGSVQLAVVPDSLEDWIKRSAEYLVKARSTGRLPIATDPGEEYGEAVIVYDKWD